jgi:transcriptional regulator with XRE-family HTH domain
MKLRVREWRERRGMSYRELAERAGIALSTLYRIESGVASPTVAMLEKLARSLDDAEAPGGPRDETGTVR